MTQNDYDDFSQMICATGELYRQNVGEFAVQLWFSALESYELSEVSKAISLHVQNPDNGQFMPKPADVIRFIQGSSTDNAYLAWAKVERSIRSIGSYSSVRFDDPLIHAVITNLGGWVKLCQTLEKDLPFLENNFRKAYTGLKATKATPDVLPYLSGIHETENSHRGYKADPVIYISSKNGKVDIDNPRLPSNQRKLLGATA